MFYCFVLDSVAVAKDRLHLDTAFTMTQLNQLYLNQFKFQPIK